MIRRLAERLSVFSVLVKTCILPWSSCKWLVVTRWTMLSSASLVSALYQNGNELVDKTFLSVGQGFSGAAMRRGLMF